MGVWLEKQTKKSNILKLLFWEKQGFKNLPGFSPFLFLMHHCSASKLLCPTRQWFPLKTPHRHCPSIPTPSTQPWIKGNARGHVKNLQSHGEIALWTVPCVPRCHSWGGSGCSDVPCGQSASPGCSRNTQPREQQQQERWFWCSVPLVSKNHLNYMDERQHNPQLLSAWCSELQLMQLIKFQSCASLHKLT